MKMALALLALSSVTLSAAAPQAYTYPSNMMTGEVVASRLLTPARSHEDIFERDIAHAYVNGIKDGTQGTLWCFAGAILPHELNIAIVSAMRQARTVEEMNGNAAPLLLAELRRRYPCKRGRA